MPKKEDIDQFKEVLKGVGKEPEVLAQKGLPNEDISPLGEGESILPWNEEGELSLPRQDLEGFDQLIKEEMPAAPLSVSPENEASSEEELTSKQGGEPQVSDPQGLDDVLDDLLGDFSIPEDKTFDTPPPKAASGASDESTSSTDNTSDLTGDSFLDDMDSLFSPTKDEATLPQNTGFGDLENILNLEGLSEEGVDTQAPDYFSSGLQTSQGLSESNNQEDDLFALDNKKGDTPELDSFEGLDDIFSFGEALGSGGSFTTEEGFALNPEEYRNFCQKLLTLPKNLRLAVAEAIVKSELSEQEVASLVTMVTNDRNFRRIAKQTGALLGKVIILPHSYYRAQELARKQESFWYNVQAVAWPVIQKGMILNVIVFLVLFLSFRFGIEPWQATTYFEEGLAALEKGQAEEANNLFKKAYNIRAWDDWFLRYAQAYEERRDYDNSATKYEELLTVEPFALGAENRRRTKFHRQGYLDYSALKTRQGLYREADDLLQSVISENVQDQDGWLARGDNYMTWATLEPTRYTDALRSYASVLEMHGDSVGALSRLLNYYVKTDDEGEAYRLYHYIESKGYPKIDAPVYTAYAAYLLKRDAELVKYANRKTEILRVGKFSEGQLALVEREFSHIRNKNQFQLNDIGNLLRRSVESDPYYPMSYYYLSHYFNRSQNEAQARQAIEEAIKYFYYKKPLTPEESIINILSFKELGRSLENTQDFLVARQYYQRGIELYENQLKLELLKPSREMTELLALQGDSYYRVYEDTQAQFFYEKALAQGYSTPQVEYAMANILYLQGDYPRAIEHLFAVESTVGYRVDANMLYTMGTTLVDNRDQESARGYYLQLLNILDQKCSIIGEIDLDNTDHQKLLEQTIKTLNNLGVAELQLAGGSTRSPYYAQGMRHLVEAEEMFDVYTRQGERKEKVLEKGLAALNLAEGWQGSMDLMYYQTLPRYLEAASTAF